MGQASVPRRTFDADLAYVLLAYARLRERSDAQTLKQARNRPICLCRPLMRGLGRRRRDRRHKYGPQKPAGRVERLSAPIPIGRPVFAL